MIRLVDLAEIVGGNIIGNRDMMITGVGSVKDGAAEGTITFAENEDLHKAAEETNAAAIIVPKSIKQSQKILIQVDHPRLAFAQIAHQFQSKPLITQDIHTTCQIHSDAQVGNGVSIHPYAVIDAGANIGDGTVIGPGVYIGKDVQVGSDCEIHANVVIEYATQIGNRVIIHAGTVIGSDGFGFVTTREGHYKLPQLGNVLIEDDVEIGANVAIDRGAIGSTVVGRGTKLDNLVHLAHNVKVGESGLIVGQAGVAGSTRLGNWVTLAGQSGVYGHLQVGDQVTLAARGVITNNVENGAFLSGAPAIDHKQDFKVRAAGRRVPDLLKKVRELEKRLVELEKKNRIKD